MRKIIWHGLQRTRQTLTIGVCLRGRNIIKVSEPPELFSVSVALLHTCLVSSTRVFQALIQRFGDFIGVSFLILGVNVFLLYPVFLLIFNNMRELKDLEKLDQQNYMSLGKISIFQAICKLKPENISFLDTTKLLLFFFPPKSFMPRSPFIQENSWQMKPCRSKASWYFGPPDPFRQGQDGNGKLHSSGEQAVLIED